MSDNLKDILSHLSTDIDQETLLLYLQDKLSEEKKHEVEKQLLENEFADDAMEGLKEMRDKQQIAYTVEMLNRDLRKRTEKKKQRREKMKLPSQTWLYISIFIILLLIILSYFVIHRMQHPTG
jgi:asparagine synthetase B (glutamine-hydrolysing)